MQAPTLSKRETERRASMPRTSGPIMLLPAEGRKPRSVRMVISERVQRQSKSTAQKIAIQDDLALVATVRKIREGLANGSMTIGKVEAAARQSDDLPEGLPRSTALYFKACYVYLYGRPELH